MSDNIDYLQVAKSLLADPRMLDLRREEVHALYNAAIAHALIAIAESLDRISREPDIVKHT